jgi:L-ascorbate metabolism protein UlaG (beta-lactamase superfamily)
MDILPLSTMNPEKQLPVNNEHVTTVNNGHVTTANNGHITTVDSGHITTMFTTSGTYPWSFVTQIFHSGQPSHSGDCRHDFLMFKH